MPELYNAPANDPARARPVRNENNATRCESFVLQYSWNVRDRGDEITRGTGRYGNSVRCVGVLEPLAVGVCMGEDSADDITNM